MMMEALPGWMRWPLVVVYMVSPSVVMIYAALYNPSEVVEVSGTAIIRRQHVPAAAGWHSFPRRITCSPDNRTVAEADWSAGTVEIYT